MALLSASRLSKSFGGVRAVDDLAFDIEPGSMFGIIGPNGAGKTSLFNVLTGFLPADCGSVTFRDTEVLGRKPHELVALGMARSFQLVKPFLGMTALETVSLPAWGRRLRSRGLSPSDIERNALDLLDRLGLGQKARVQVDDLNQGELRLLDIGRAIATEPAILFLDEPFSGLGHDEIERLSTLLLALKNGGTTIVIIEHRLRELMRLVERVMVINFGAKLAEGRPADIVRDPGVIAAYLGTSGDELSPA